MEIRFFRSLLCRVPALLLAMAMTIFAGSVRVESQTMASAEYQKCQIGNGYGFVAWMPEILAFCWKRRDPDPKGGVAAAIRMCSKFLPKSMKKANVSCVAAYDGQRIVDPRFKRAMTRYTAIPGKVTIYDAKSGKLQKGNVRMERTPWKDVLSAKFRLVSNGIEICNGAYRQTKRSNRIDYTARCFGEEFSGSTRKLSLISSQGTYFLVPPVVRIEKDGSYIEFTP